MNYEKYIEQRNKLMDEAENLIGNQKFEDSENKMQEVRDLDDQYEQIKAKEADLNALKDNEQVANLQNKSQNVQGANVMTELDNTNPMNGTVDYKTAWAKNMMGQTLSDQEQQVFNQMNNAYTHQTGNSEVVIPETVADGIFARAEEDYPFLNDVKKFAVEGNLTMVKHDSVDAGDAGFYTEDEEVSQEQNSFGEINLTGKEVAKAVTVSWKLKAMSVDAFLAYIQDELGKRIGRVLGEAVLTGKGNEKEPHGVLTALKDTDQVVEYSGEIKYQDVTSALAKVHSSYLSNASIYASNSTIWNQLANIVDGNGRPMFIPEPSANSVGRLFGKPVLADAGVPEGTVVVGNPNEGAVFNTNQGFQIVSEDHARKRTTDYVAYAIVDSDVVDEQAFVSIKKKQA